MYNGAKMLWRNSHDKNPAAPAQHNHMLRYRSTERKSRIFTGRPWTPVLFPLSVSLTNFQISSPSKNPGTPDTKNAHRQPYRAATCVVNTGATANPTSAAALTTIPIFRPRRVGCDDSSIIAVIMDHAGPSAIPSSARTSRSWWKLCTIPEIQDNIEKMNTTGTRIGFRPMRSESAPKKSVDKAQVTATTEPSMPICWWLK